jgi:uncharacterized membrane protein
VSDDTRPPLTERSPISISLVVLLAGGIAGGAWWASAMTSRIGRMQHDLDRIASRLDDAAGDRWRRTDHRQWTSVLRDLNPNLVISTVPDP